MGDGLFMSATQILPRDSDENSGSTHKGNLRTKSQLTAPDLFNSGAKIPAVYQNGIRPIANSHVNSKIPNLVDALDPQQIDMINRFVSYAEITKDETSENTMRSLGISISNTENEEIKITIGSRFFSDNATSTSQDGEPPAVLIVTKPDNTTIIAETVRHSADAVSTRILDSKSGNIFFEANYRILPNGNFAVNAPVSIAELDSATSLNDLNLAAWSVFEVFYRRSKSVKEQESKDDRKLQAGKPSTMCINHDLFCTSPFGGKFTFWVWVPCKGTFEIDVKDCCLDHDIGWWCARSPFEKIAADGFVAACFARKIIAFVSNKTPWYCGGGFTGSIIGLAQALLFSNLIFYGLLPFYPREGRVGGGFVQGDPDSTSCLCGGNVPTIKCDENQSDPTKWLCPKPYCTKCAWDFDIDSGGNISNCVMSADRLDLPCCPGLPEDVPNLDTNLCAKPVKARRLW